MLSYQNLVKSLVDEAIYKRGLKIYLEGFVSTPRNMILDNWRLYSVRDVHDVYFVKTPVLHLALASDKFDLAGSSVEESVSCSCSYFLEYGICKHIVAVFADLDNEFSKSYSQNEASTENLMEAIFASDTVKKHRKWLETIDQLLSRDTTNYYYLDEISRTLKNQEDIHQPFFKELAKIIEGVIGDYSREKRLVRIISESILVNRDSWLDFWREYFTAIDVDNQIRLYISLWKIYWVTSKNKEEFLEVFISPDQCIKENVFNELHGEFIEDKMVWIEYAFASRYYDWLIDNMDRLDPKLLIRIAEIFPEKREEIEIKIMNQIKQWSDFLPSGDYEMVVDVFKTWSQKLGKSDYYMDSINYFRANHRLKKKLLSQLD